MKAPIKLIKEDDVVKGIFDHSLNFVEGSCSAGYKTALFSMYWYQFPQQGFDEMRAKVMENFVDWYNKRPETVESFIKNEMDKMFLDTWTKEEALKHLTKKVEEFYE